MELTVFSIDKGSDLHTLAKFLRHVDTQQAMGKLMGPVQLAIGSWQGVLEHSFIMLSEDFKRHIKGSGYVSSQDCVLLISSDTRQPVILKDLQSGERVKLGKLRGGKGPSDFTYALSTGEYFHVSPD